LYSLSIPVPATPADQLRESALLLFVLTTIQYRVFAVNGYVVASGKSVIALPGTADVSFIAPIFVSNDPG